MADDRKTTPNEQTRIERKEAYLRGIYDRYTGQFRTLGKQADASVASRIHLAMDEVLERDLKANPKRDDIRCHKGCDHCCHGPVEIWPHEAALLVEAARVAGIELDRARLERQARNTEDTWRQQPAADKACEFLSEDGACKVYPSRPNACRKLLVTTDPALCDGDKHPLSSVDRWFSWEAEVMEASALEICGAALMPKALLEVLNKAG